MKKFIYILLFSALSSMALNACTEENVTPTKDNGGAAGSGDKLPY